MNIKEGIITSKSNPTVIRVRALAEKKYRDAYGLFRTDGVKLAIELDAHGISPETVLLRESSVTSVMSRLPDAFSGVTATVLSDAIFDRISEEKSPEGIICAVKYLDNLEKIATINRGAALLPADARAMMIESVRDPGNLGTIVRSAAAFGVDTLIVSSDCADLYNPKTVRASMGALFGLRIISAVSLKEVIEVMRAQGRRVFGAALDRDAHGLDALKLEAGDCFVVGNEGHGLSHEVLAACDSGVFIPIAESSESLNAAIAASVLLWEQKRQLG